MITLSLGNIVDSKHKYIVNSANSALILGSGVAGEIRKKGGISIQYECDKIKKRLGNIEIGTVFITSGGVLDKEIIHTVIKKIGPSNVTSGDVVIATKNTIDFCLTGSKYGIALPAFGTGSGGLDPDISAWSMRLGIQQALNKNTSNKPIDIEIFLPNNRTLNIFRHIFGTD